MEKGRVKLQKIKGGTYKEILNAECAEILSQTANRKSTKLASKDKIVRRQSPVNVIFLGYKGGKEVTLLKMVRQEEKQTTYYLHNRLPDRVWNYIYTRTRAKTQEAFGISTK